MENTSCVETRDVAAQPEPAAAPEEQPGSPGHITDQLQGLTEPAASTGTTTKCPWEVTENRSDFGRPEEDMHRLPLKRKFRENHRNPHTGKLHEHLQKMRREQEASERASDLCGVRTGEGGTRPDSAGLQPCLRGDAAGYPRAEPPAGPGFSHTHGMYFSVLLGASLRGNSRSWQSCARMPQKQGRGAEQRCTSARRGSKQGSWPQEPAQSSSMPSATRHTLLSGSALKRHLRPRQCQAITFRLEIAPARALSWGAEHL